MTPIPLVPRVSTRNRRNHVMLLTTGVPLLLVIAFAVSIYLSPPRYVKGTESTGYQYLLLGNEADVVKPTRPGLVLEGGGTDIDESFRWMIERSGGGDFLVIRTSGTDAYNIDIYSTTAANGLRPDSAATLIVRTREAAFDLFVIQTIKSAEAPGSPGATRPSTSHSGTGRPSRMPSTIWSGGVCPWAARARAWP